MSMTPQSTSQPTLMKTKAIPIIITPLCILQCHLFLSMDNPNNPGPNTNQTPSIADIGTCPAPTLFPLIVIISHCFIPSDPVLTILVHTPLSFTLASLLPLTLGY